MMRNKTIHALRLVCILIVLLCVAQSSFSETRHALVIGNDNYPGNALINARNDAKSMGDALRGMGYSVTEALDLDRNAMIRAITTFSDSLQAGDTALIFYAGHGVQVNGENYLIPVDFRASGEQEVRDQGYSISNVLELFIQHGAGLKVIILDACRNNPFLGTRSAKGGWAGIGTSANTLVAFGTSPGSTASDDPSQPHGLFTQMLLRNLNSPLDIEQVLQTVRLEVVRASSGQQVPWVASSLMSSVHFQPRLDANTNPSTSMASNTPVHLIEKERALTPASDHETAVLSALPTEAVDASSGTTTNQAKLILVQEALRLAQVGEYDEAVRSIHAILEQDPRCVLALRVLGLLFHLMGKAGTAAEALSRALSIDPTDAMSLYYRCVFTVASDPTSAIRDCEASLGRDPNSASTHAMLASALLNSGKVAEAESEAKRAVDLDATSDLAASVHGKVLLAEGRLAAAQREFQRAIDIQITPQ